MISKINSYLLWKLSGSKGAPAKRVIYITESRDWVIKRVGNYIAEGLDSCVPTFKMDVSAKFYFNSIIHFGSAYGFSVDGYRIAHPSNKLVVTIFHGDYGINEGMDYTIRKIVEHKDRISRIIVSNTIMEKRVASWGIAPEKISLIPLGTDLRYFKPDASIRKEMRMKLGIPEDAVCIGSFEKDGDGWGDGLVPKMIKGPDIFVRVAKELSRDFKVHCLLTGPSRGYMKKKLDESGIAYTHRFLEKYFDIVNFYRCLDLYLVTSRDQGGPETVLESMATGIPVVSTRVGMAQDIIIDRKNALLADVDDVAGLARAARAIIEESGLRSTVINEGLNTVKSYDWGIIAKEYGLLYGEIIQ